MRIRGVGRARAHMRIRRVDRARAHVGSRVVDDGAAGRQKRARGIEARFAGHGRMQTRRAGRFESRQGAQMPSSMRVEAHDGA
jgi:hypothetical protein